MSVVLVTGSSSGIGLATALHFARLGDDVYAGVRNLANYPMQMKTPSQPADVARVIHEAATTKAPKLRYLVGDDAERLVAGRQRLTDEEYVATGRLMPDAEYLDLMRQRYGFEW
jgi:NAD(P)-dependent dehydrogenase (short-subunit alcohol dehydrogenase family)